ncbi:MAG: hypothetical protein IKB62_08375 [Oscillospiraceae bacterium]|nr:hypothetical protein [Oscillospiraceae bacterium]
MDFNLLIIIAVILIIPLIFGICARFVLCRYRYGWAVTVIALICTLSAWYVYLNPPVLGSELYGLRAVQASCFTLGALAVGIISRKHNI